MDVPSPTQVHVNSEAQTLSVHWSDGHTSVFPLDDLRDACPCATCKGHTVNYIAPPHAQEGTQRQKWTNVRVETAGSVGLRIEWDDGHNSGIYRWDRLRQLQPPGA